MASCIDFSFLRLISASSRRFPSMYIRCSSAELGIIREAPMRACEFTEQLSSHLLPEVLCSADCCNIDATAADKRSDWHG